MTRRATKGQSQFLLGRQDSLRSSGVTPQPAAREISAKAAAKRPQRTEVLPPLPSSARPNQGQSPLPAHRVETRGLRIPNRWGRSKLLRSFWAPRGPPLCAPGARRPPGRAIPSPVTSPEPASTCSTGPRSLPAGATCPCRAPLRPPAVPALPALCARPRAAGDRGDQRSSPAGSVTPGLRRPDRSAPALRGPRPGPVTQAYPWWRLQGLPATGERGVQAGGLFFEGVAPMTLFPGPAQTPAQLEVCGQGGRTPPLGAVG